MYDRIRELCAQRGVSIQALEKSCDLSNGAISKWNTSIPRADALLRVARYFGVDPWYLLTGASKTGKPATDAGDGWKDAVRALPPDLLGLLSDFVLLAKEDPETARRYLAFAVQELQSRQ